MKTLKNFSPREAYAAYVLGSVLVDVRDDKPTDAKTADVKRMVTLPFSELDQRFGELPANRPVVLLSRIGIKGKQAAKFLLEKGYQDVATVDGGLTAWEEEGLPVRSLD
jgi:rhodanese-related sulfurtransferase